MASAGERPLVDLRRIEAPDHAIECAASLFLERGIANVKMTDVAEAAGVGVATLYRRYATKTRIAIEAATLLWGRFNLEIHELIDSDAFLKLDGASRLKTLLTHYADAYSAHRDFVAFLDEYDHLLVSEDLDPDELVVYGAEVDSFYLIFEDAYLLGRQDGSIVREIDFDVFYRAIAHALMGVAEKFARGEIIPSDHFEDGDDELACLVDMAIRSLTKN